MYLTEVSDVIDHLLDHFHQDLKQSETYRLLIKETPIRYVQYAPQITAFIQQFINTMDRSSIQKLINNPQKEQLIGSMIERYLIYYYFLQIAYYYTGTAKQYGSNLIEYSRSQNSNNLFNAETNYLLLQLFQLTKEVASVIVMTDLQKNTLNKSNLLTTFDFIDQLGVDYVANHLISVKEGTIVVNVHHLIKTIILRQVYAKTDKLWIEQLLTDTVNEENDYIYIDVVVAKDYATDVQTFNNLFLGRTDARMLANRFVDLTNTMDKIAIVKSATQKISEMFSWNVIYPIVDDFLRYHLDTQNLETYGSIIPINNNYPIHAKSALINAQRRKAENTRAEMIVNSIDTIADLYSTQPENNKETSIIVQKVLTNPFDYRKAVLINYLDEMKVLTKIKNTGLKISNENEYYLELQQIMKNAYFNFRILAKEGMVAHLSLDKPIDMVRYSNIEYQKNQPKLHVETYTGTNDKIISLVGLTVAPLTSGPIQCIRKRSLLDIRKAPIYYYKNNQLIQLETTNGYRAFTRLIKYFYIHTIEYRTNIVPQIYVDLTKLTDVNRRIINKLIYWNFKIETDIFEPVFYDGNDATNTDTIKSMMVAVYDKLIHYLSNRLVQLIHLHHRLSIDQIENLIILYSMANKLHLSEMDRRLLVIKHYLSKQSLLPKVIYEERRQPMPVFHQVAETGIFRMKINILNPLAIAPYYPLNLYAADLDQSIHALSNISCVHEEEWKVLSELKNVDIHQYNVSWSQFMQKFAFQTNHLQYACKICNQLLPVTQFSQEGSFDDNTEQFVSAYIAADTPLDQIPEYAKYKTIIRYFDVLINRIALIAQTNLLIGSSLPVVQKRQEMIQLMIDLVIVHYKVNQQTNLINRADFYTEQFNILANLDTVRFFELDDKIITNVNTDTGAIKYNNLLLYLMCFYFTELNGSQIVAITFDKTINVYTFLKYQKILFTNLLIKQNINGTETVPVTAYPVFCYLLYSFSYFLIKYGLWAYPNRESKKYDPSIAKIIIHSMLDLWNSISLAANDYSQFKVYSIVVTRLYTALHTTFNNHRIIDLLKTAHVRYAPAGETVEMIVPKFNKIIYPIQSIVTQTPVSPIVDYQVNSGLQFNKTNNISYSYAPIHTTHCNDGSFKLWTTKNKSIESINCQTNEFLDNKDILDRFYYRNLQSIANRRCLIGSLHDFVYQNNQWVCTICHQLADFHYSTKQLDTLVHNLNVLEQSTVHLKLNEKSKNKSNINQSLKTIDSKIDLIVQSYFKDKITRYGQIPSIVDHLINLMESHLGENTNLNIDKYPVYLRHNVYVIDHLYTEVNLNVPIIVTEKENKIKLINNHPKYRTDVYYYTDYNAHVDVFYNAVTFNLIGYKEQSKDFVYLENSQCYLKMSPSVAYRLAICGHDASYVNISELYQQNEKLSMDKMVNYTLIMDNLIRDHLTKTKLVFDKMASTLFKIKYYSTVKTTHTNPESIIENALHTIVSKYARLIDQLEVDNAFEDWADLRESLIYDPVNWKEVTIELAHTYVSAQLINFYDFSANVLFYYFINQLIVVLNLAAAENIKISICNMYIEIINYVYAIYNIDPYIHTTALKKFDYILHGSSYLIDATQSGEGLLQLELAEIEDDLSEEDPDEILDVEETANALDIEIDKNEDEDEAYAQEND